MPATEQEHDIPVTAAIYDQVLQHRDEGQFTLQEVKDLVASFRRHVEAVAERDKRMFDQIGQIACVVSGLSATVGELAATVARNGERLTVLEQQSAAVIHAREDYEMEIINLHTAMREWHRTHIDERGVLETALRRLDAAAVAELPPPASLPSHYIKQRRRAS